MAKESATHESEAPIVPQCRHHWLIETPNGAMSRGVCKVCGAEREFPNSAQDSLWEGESVPNAGAGRIPRGGPRDSFRDDQGMGSTVSYATWLGSRREDDGSF